MAHFKNKLIDISRFDIFLNAGFWCCFWLLYVYSVCNNVTTHEYIDGLSDYFGNIPAIVKLIISMRVMIDGLWLLGHEIQSYSIQSTIILCETMYWEMKQLYLDVGPSANVEYYRSEIYMLTQQNFVMVYDSFITLF